MKQTKEKKNKHPLPNPLKKREQNFQLYTDINGKK